LSLETAVEQNVMESNTDKAGLRVRAVLALLRGRPAAEVSAEMGVCRSDLYKFRKRALTTMQEALRDRKRGPVAPHNRLEAEQEAAVQGLCERHPTLSKVTLTDEDRTAYQLTLLDDCSRAYVYCDRLRDPTLNDTIRALIAAMRQYQTIPKGVVFDNGTPFKGYLLSAFCTNLGIRLIHSSVRHPQTNGKLERAFRDDRREYYDHFDEWIFDELRKGLPEYVRYRNEIRGHYALGGKPTITRLQEQDWFALPSVLGRLESFARHSFGTTPVKVNGCIRVLGRNGYIPKLRYGQKVSLIETLEGLEAETKDGSVYLLRDYRKFRRIPSYRRDELPFCFTFEEYKEGHSPRIAVAIRQ
jgi:transposase InsO family protein